MVDAAKKAGVSQPKVSFVLSGAPISISEEVRRRIFKVAKKLNFTPHAKAKNDSNPSERIIALLIPNASNIYYMELTKHISHFIGERG